jgi:hypothetical protein
VRPVISSLEKTLELSLIFDTPLSRASWASWLRLLTAVVAHKAGSQTAIAEDISLDYVGDIEAKFNLKLAFFFFRLVLLYIKVPVSTGVKCATRSLPANFPTALM